MQDAGYIFSAFAIPGTVALPVPVVLLNRTSRTRTYRILPKPQCLLLEKMFHLPHLLSFSTPIYSYQQCIISFGLTKN